MSLERLNEALERVHHNEAWPMGLNTRVALGEVCEAARAYADLLAKGAEPDYEAAARAGYEATNVYQSGSVPEWEGASPYNQAQWRAWSRVAVDAAIGDRLLINPPIEEE